MVFLCEKLKMGLHYQVYRAQREMEVHNLKNLQGQWTMKATARTVTQFLDSHFKSSACQI